MNKNRVIGANNEIPWHLPEDLKRFSKLTTGHTVLMGRKTYASLPYKFRPLPNRKNIVVTRNGFVLPNEVDVTGDPKAYISEFPPDETLWVIGGEQIYRETLALWSEIYLTLVDGEHKGDTFFPEFEKDFRLVEEERKEGFSFQHHIRLN